MQGRSGTSRQYDAERTKRAILDAAEAAFAKAGYSGARIDAIAREAGCNKSLIYQYIGDKLQLYTAVVRRVDEAGDKALAQSLSAALRDKSVTSNPEKFRHFLASVVGVTFQFLFQNPHYVQILFWEAAADWSTWNQLSYRPDDPSELIRVVERARKAGVVRADFDPALFAPLVMTSTAGLMRFSRRFGGDGGSGARVDGDDGIDTRNDDGDGGSGARVDGDDGIVTRNDDDGEADSRGAGDGAEPRFGGDGGLKDRPDGARQRHLHDQVVSLLVHGMLHPKHL